MLNIIYGEIEDEKYISDPDIYFNNTYEDAWLIDEFSREMISDIDKSTVVGPNLIDSPFLGPIPPKQLSGGVKTLILINNDNEHIFNASACGDNCAKWLLKIAADKKVVINLRHLMDFGQDEFKIRILNTGKIVKNMGELVSEAGKYVWGSHERNTPYRS